MIEACFYSPGPLTMSVYLLIIDIDCGLVSYVSDYRHRVGQKTLDVFPNGGHV